MRLAEYRTTFLSSEIFYGRIPIRDKCGWKIGKNSGDGGLFITLCMSLD